MAGKRADFIGNPDLPHTYSYVPDVAAGLATLGTDERAVGGCGTCPARRPSRPAQCSTLVAQRGRAPGRHSLGPKLVVRALGLFNPMMRELAEMAYEFEEPFVLDTTKYQSTFGAAGTPLAAADRLNRRLVPRPAPAPPTRNRQGPDLMDRADTD